MIPDLAHTPSSYFPGGLSAVLVDYGVTLEANGRLEEATSVFERALIGGDAAARAGILLNLGNILRKTGQRDGAVERYQEAIALNPSYAAAHFNLGLVLIELDRPDEAFASLGAARRFGATDVDSLAREVSQLDLDGALAREDYRAAYRVLERLNTAVDETAQDAFLKGVLADRIGETNLARRHFQQALAIDPEHQEAKQALARLK